MANPSNNSEVVIFSEDFEGVFPDDNDWVVEDLELDDDSDYWGATEYKAYSGDYSAWCAQVGESAGWIRIFKEDFENGFGDGINGWSVGDTNPTDGLDYWEDVDYDFGDEGTHSGDLKAYCAGVGYSGSASEPNYDSYMEAYMSRTIDLTGYTQARIEFYHKLISTDLSSIWDYAEVLVDGSEVTKYTSQILTWNYANIDLNAYVGGTHEITFKFHSDEIIQGEGWYIDSIRLFAYVPDLTPNSQLLNYDYSMEAILENVIDLSDYVSANLSYYYWIESEINYDYLYVETSSDGLSWDIEKSYTGDSYGWEADSLDLTSFTGSTAYIRFLFLSDDKVNDFEGAYLDDIEIIGITHNDAYSGGDAGDDFDSATDISAGNYEGIVSSVDINDCYKIFMSAGIVIDVNMTPSSGSNFDLALYDPDLDLLDSSTLSGSVMESISHTAETSGDHYILVSYISGSSTYTLDIEIEDHIAPILVITSPANGIEVKSTAIQVIWVGLDADSGIDYYEVNIDGGSWINVVKTNSYNFLGLSEGSHVVHVRAFDGENNSKEVAVNFTVNTSLILGPGWIEEIAVFALIGIIVIGIIFFLVRRR